MSARINREAGFTLIELIVVLAILAVLATMALTATSGLNTQIRYEKTAQTFDQLETAIYGKAHAFGSAYGFLADLGTFPVVDAKTKTNELIEQGNLPTYFYNNNIKLGYGWRGPYILPPDDNESFTDILDGWGNPIFLEYNAIIKGYQFRSTGEGLGKAIIRKFPSEKFLHGEIYFEIYNHMTDISEKPVEVTGLEIFLLHPNPNDPNGYELIPYPDKFDIGHDSSVNGRFPADDNKPKVTCGFRSVKLFTGSVASYKEVQVIGGGVSKITFHLTGIQD